MNNHAVTKMSKRIIFISDLHLSAHQPQITAQFTSLLHELNPENDQLYILGDLFETWIGDDDNNTFNHMVKSALTQATKSGLEIFIILGNRDFLLGTDFFQSTGCVLLPDEFLLNAFNTSILLMHGDTLCTRDTGYQYFRKLTRNKLFKYIYTHLPIALRQKLANTARKESSKQTRKKPDDIMDVTQAAVIKVMRKHHANYLIHGHTHKPAIHDIEIDNQSYKRIVLSAWDDTSAALVWEDTGQYKVVQPISALFSSLSTPVSAP